MSTETLVLVAAAGLLWWKWRLKKGNATPHGTALDRINAGVPDSGDTESTWWDKFHGRDVVVADHTNSLGGVATEPGLVGKVIVANSVNLGWNGDITA